MTPPDPHLLPAALAPHTVEGLLADRGPARPWIHRVTLALAGAALLALPLVEVDVTVRAPGLVRATTERTELRTPQAGRISRVLVADNTPVTAGQVILALDTTALDARLAHNRSRQDLARRTMRELDLLSTAAAGVAVIHHPQTPAAAVEPSPPPGTEAPGPLPLLLSPAAAAGAVADVTGSDEAATGDFSPGHRRPADYAAPIFPSLSVPALREEWSHLLAQLETHRLAAARARTELERTTLLFNRGLATQRELDDTRYAVERAQAEAILLRQQTLSRWQSRRQEEHLVLIALVSEAAHLGDERTSSLVRAPLAGTFLGSGGLASGVYLPPGHLVGTISPDDTLLVEARVPSRSIGFLTAGQPVKLQVETFAYTAWGLLDGTLTSIAADLTALPAASGLAPDYRVLIAPRAPALHRPDGATARLRKGMAVQARFPVGRRTLLQLLHEDLAAGLDPRSSPTT